MTKRPITVIKGDGIGPEIVEATCAILDAAKVPFEWRFETAGKKVFEAGEDTGISSGAIKSIQETKWVLKGPLETPIGYGERSANVALRKLLTTYANVRPVYSLPMVKTPFDNHVIDLIVIRENLEDTYMGIEHMQNPWIAQSLKHISTTGCNRLFQYAFQYTNAMKKKSIHCVTKANILKLTEGLFKSSFEEISKKNPRIHAKHMLVDNCAHQLVINPEQFDVIVCSNLHGDILSDLSSGLVGGLGVSCSANIGDEHTIFEAVHGSAPDIAGKGIANPISLLLTALLLLDYADLKTEATQIRNALFYTLEQGIATPDLLGSKGVSTAIFTQSVIQNLGQKSTFQPSPRLAPFQANPPTPIKNKRTPVQKAVGLDIFFSSQENTCDLVTLITKLTIACKLRFKRLYNHSVLVHPQQSLRPKCDSLWQARFFITKGHLLESDLLDLLAALGKGLPWTHIEKLWNFDGKAAYSE